jgi:hypothetical protein
MNYGAWHVLYYLKCACCLTYWLWKCARYELQQKRVKIFYNLWFVTNSTKKIFCLLTSEDGQNITETSVIYNWTWKLLNEKKICNLLPVICVIPGFQPNHTDPGFLVAMCSVDNADSIYRETPAFIWDWPLTPCTAEKTIGGAVPPLHYICPAMHRKQNVSFIFYCR